MLKLKKFCFGFSLRVGTLITLLMHIVIDLFVVLFLLIQSTSVLYFWMGAFPNLISVIVSIQGIYGVLKNEPKQLIPFIAWNTFVAMAYSGIIMMLLKLIVALNNIHTLPKEYSSEEKLMASITYLIILSTVAWVYTILVVYSYYKKVLEGQPKNFVPVNDYPNSA